MEERKDRDGSRYLPEGNSNYRFSQQEEKRREMEDQLSHTRYPVRERTYVPGKGGYPVREDTYIPGKSGYPAREETAYPRRRRIENADAEKKQTERQDTGEERRYETRVPRRAQAESEIKMERSAQQEFGGWNEEKGNPQRSQRHPSTRGTQKNSAERKRKRRNQKLFRLILVLIAALIIGILCFRLGESLMGSSTEEVTLTGETVMVTIPEGAGTSEIADILKENKLIGSKLSFRISSRLNGYDGTFKQGTYEIDTGLTQTQIMDLLQSGEVATDNKLTIPEGYNTRQIAAKVEELGICTAAEFIEEANTGVFEYDFLNDLPDREYRLEGYLFPDTYFLTENMTAHDVIDMMLKRFDQMYTTEYQNAVASSGHTLDEIVIIASMVEKEITLDDERSKAASVIYNRLEEDMSLGIDATVLYGLGRDSGSLTQEDLEKDTPYNTRLNKGLPEGPIANPGEASFRAAVYPDTTNYLYYVLEAEGQSNHVFCETYEQFLAAKETYQASLSQ
ncbi:endolytic transglycosylase MltG [Anaerotignum lactatifermentans]|uniref:Endolytic murein transglycosylase n=1 Tax=Anaerotignum lactatifermentans TaxID=160404 RepID=A0ABS2GAT8_9FIRM|nr:endolytic transglycosylase MltG [Anaerotignum lactatifermentans]MBM6828393.1 endolytic transglycosylase MltG [Anaerotignum lactatifermentans]MBM6877673.1 endolytic transglycosylase MltG [Anaerotignum lactatifermentans]MBM6949976.1 endolytic transglycosylase MltG [Anaerotignum lactatifermentans]